MDKSDSTDDSRQTGDEHSQTGGPPHEAPRRTTIDTARPVIDRVVEHPTDRKPDPDASISVETTQVSESDLLAATGVPRSSLKKTGQFSRPPSGPERPQSESRRSAGSPA